MAVLNFDASQVPEASFDPLPAGDYLLWITESDIPIDQEGNQKVEVTYEVVEPQQYAGRKVWDSFTLENHQNPKWAEVGRQILATLCRAVGVMSPRETEELHGIPFCARLEVETWKDGSLHNKVVARWSTSSQAPPQKKPKGAPPAAPQALRPGAQTGYMPQAPQYQPQQAPYQPPAGPPAWAQPQQPPQGQPPQQGYQPPPGDEVPF